MWQIFCLFTNWMKNKKATRNLINKNGTKYFEYLAKLALSDKKIGKNHKRMSKIIFFGDKYNWERINYPSEKDD